MTIQPLPGPAGDRDRPRLMVVPANRGGSVQHFYHFLFGYLLPFLEHGHALRRTHRFLLRDCGPMNGLLKELDEFLIDVIPAHLVLTSLVGVNGAVGGLPKLIVPGFDAPQAYDAARFRRLRDLMQALYGTHIAAAAAKYPAAASDQLVLLVDRAPPHPFYAGAASENRSAGASRRSLPNIAELHAALAAHHDVLTVQLETCSLFEQIHLFSRAWRVVGQHGAALAHMIWARPDAGLVEILPNPDRVALAGIAHGDFFAAICARLGIPWRVVMQAAQHAPVEPAEVLAALAGLQPGT
jgi:hypothetical protein